MSRQCRSGQHGPHDLVQGGAEWDTTARDSPACLHAGKDLLVALGAHVGDIYQVGMAGKGLWAQRGAHHGVTLNGKHQPCPQEPPQSSWELRDIPAPALSPACLLMQHCDLLPQRHHR